MTSRHLFIAPCHDVFVMTSWHEEVKKHDTSVNLIINNNASMCLFYSNFTQRVTNEEIRKRLNIKKNLIQAVMRRKLGLFGNVCRMKNNRKIKDVMIGMMEGTGRRGKPCRENGWVTERTGARQMSIN